MKRYILPWIIIALTATGAEAQAPKPCGYIGTASLAKYAYCIDTLKKRLDSVLRADHQIRLSIADIYAKLPPNGRTTQEYVNSAVASIPPGSGSGGVLGNRVVGDLIVNGRVCVVEPGLNVGCDGDHPALVHLASSGNPNYSAILSRANIKGEYCQPNTSCVAQYGIFDFSGDGGVGFGQNTDFRSREFIDPVRPVAIWRMDSQGAPSWYLHEPGQPYPGTQTFVITKGGSVIDMVSWREDISAVRLCTSSQRWNADRCSVATPLSATRGATRPRTTLQFDRFPMRPR